MNTLQDFDWNELDRMAELEEATAKADDAELWLEKFGIVNRRTARRAGLRNAKAPQRMAVPKSRGR